jgi:predicted enzyme related to lactoylglutathione lyase
MVNDIQKTIKDIETSGGKIVQQVGADAPEITARFSDPFGNVFGLYQEPA